VTGQEQLAAEFETHRPYLHAIGFRMLGSHADADDAVQEAWLRLARVGGDSIGDLRGWLTAVTGRICLDALRRRGVRGEQPLELSVGTLPREVAGDSRADPEQEILLADSVGLALYVVMDAARPDAVSHPALVDGDPGILITAGGQPITIIAFTVTDGAITAMRVLTDPDRLAQVVPSWAA
jgi:predicted RNA polymerase sigma factor